MASSILFNSNYNLSCATLTVSGKALDGSNVAPFIVSSDVYVPNLYVERSLYSDASGNIISPAFTIANNSYAGNVLTGTGANTAEWLLPNVRSNILTVTGSASLGKVLTGTGAGTADWQIPGTIQGNITSNFFTANVANVVNLTVTGVTSFTGTVNISGNITATNVTTTSNVTAGNVNINNNLSVGGDSTFTGISNFTGNVNAANVNSTHIHNTGSSNLDGAIIAGSTIVATGNITAPHFLGTHNGAVVGTTITGTSLALTGGATVGTTLGVTGAVTGASFSTTGQLTSTVSTGTAPLVISSTTRVSNLNAATCGTADIANGLKSATTTVSVSSATAPSSGQVLTATSSTAATWQTPSSSGSGMVEQIVADMSLKTFNSSGTTMDYTPGIPVITDGTQVMSLAITPTNANSYLKIEAQVCYYAAAGAVGRDSIALFQSGVTDALTQNTNRRFNTNEHNQMVLVWYVLAGSTSVRTYSVRCGNEHGYVMSNVTNQIPNTYILITEYLF